MDWVERNLKERTDSVPFVLMFMRYPEGMAVALIDGKEVVAVFRMDNDHWGRTAVLTPYESCSIDGVSPDMLK